MQGFWWDTRSLSISAAARFRTPPGLSGVGFSGREEQLAAAHGELLWLRLLRQHGISRGVRVTGVRQ